MFVIVVAVDDGDVATTTVTVAVAPLAMLPSRHVTTPAAAVQRARRGRRRDERRPFGQRVGEGDGERRVRSGVGRDQRRSEVLTGQQRVGFEVFVNRRSTLATMGVTVSLVTYVNGWPIVAAT